MACFSCGKRVAHLWTAYRAAVEGGAHPNDACAALGLTRGCCKRMLMTHTNEVEFRVMFASEPAPEFRSEARTARTHPPRRLTTLPLRDRPEWRAPEPAAPAPAPAPALDDAAPAAPVEEPRAEVRPPWAACSWTPVVGKSRA